MCDRFYGGGPLCSPTIREQPRKSPSWIGLIIWHWQKYFWKNHLTLENLTFIWQLYKTEWERNIKGSKHKTYMMWGILDESCFSEVVARWDRVGKLNAFEDLYLAWKLLLRDQFLMQETKYLTSHFCCFSGIMLLRNLKYIRICGSANRQFVLRIT